MNRSLDFSRQRLACLSDASRFRLVLNLLESEGCVSDLARRVGLSQSCTTRHLQALQGVGLVKGVRDGKRVVFRAQQEARDMVSLLGASIEGGLVHRDDGAPLGGWLGQSMPRPTVASRRRGPVHVEAAFETLIEAASDADLPMPETRDIDPPRPPGPQRSRNEIEDFLL